MPEKEIKQLFLDQLFNILERKTEAAISAIESAKESRDSDTKSSAGDKYETSRAMMQIEIEKNEVQLSKIINLKNDLSLIDTQKEYTKVEFGSLVKTNQGTCFISIGMGKVTVDVQSIFAISIASPIGKLLLDKVVGDIILFQGREFVIKEIF
ncbi:MAG: 3-oxoacyl-ACP synthase [Mariniphaga sp.]|nr:3-oxoacyl-ACP synthase [Mariniphaga sp.]